LLLINHCGAENKRARALCLCTQLTRWRARDVT